MDCAEVCKNCLLPNLSVFRVYDEIDGDNRLHHSYQLQYTGDMETGLEQDLLRAEVITPTKVVVVVPVSSAVLLNHYDSLKAQMVRQGKVTSAAAKSHSTGVTNYNSDKALKKFRLLISFEKTGETLTNEVWTPRSGQLGVIKPKSTLFNRTVKFNDTDYETTDLVVLWTVARVEPTKRYSVVQQQQTAGNLVFDDLSAGATAGIAGMNVDDD